MITKKSPEASTENLDRMQRQNGLLIISDCCTSLYAYFVWNTQTNNNSEKEKVGMKGQIYNPIYSNLFFNIKSISSFRIIL